MNRFEKIMALFALVAVVLASPYLIAKYKAFSYAYGQAPGPEPVESTPHPDINTREDVLAPNGKATLTLKKTVSKEQTTYTVTTDNGLYFSKSVPKGETITIPFNAWSPDNRYIFLKNTKDGVDNYLVLSSSGAELKGELTVNVTDYFNQKLPDFKLGEITGWAAESLLVINANNPDGSQGPSYWFDLSNNSFIRLSNRFN